MIKKLRKRVCLECSTSWGVDEKSETTAALYSLANTANAIKSSGTQRAVSQMGAMQGLQAQEQARTCPNCHAKNFREEEYYAEDGAEEERVVEVKTCPKCAEEVKIAAAKCKHCGHEFDADSVKAAIASIEGAKAKATHRQEELKARFADQAKQSSAKSAYGVATFICVVAELVGLMVVSSVFLKLNGTVGSVVLIAGLVAILATIKKLRRWIESNARKSLAKKGLA